MFNYDLSLERYDIAILEVVAKRGDMRYWGTSKAVELWF